jgi:hypothetical protein
MKHVALGIISFLHPVGIVSNPEPFPAPVPEEIPLCGARYRCNVGVGTA